MTECGFWLVVTGTGRCGTGYMAQVLSSVGVKCSHEGVFQHDPPDKTLEKLKTRLRNAWWGWEASSSWLAAPYLDRPELAGVRVVHLTRHPKKVIDSQMRIRAFAERDNGWRQWQLRWLPELHKMPPLQQAATFYVRWNRLIERKAPDALRWRIEDSTLALLDRLGIDWHDRDVYGDKRYNSRGGWGQSDADLDGLPEPIRSELRDITLEYGYEWPGR